MRRYVVKKTNPKSSIVPEDIKTSTMANKNRLARRWAVVCNVYNNTISRQESTWNCKRAELLFRLQPNRYETSQTSQTRKWLLAVAKEREREKTLFRTHWRWSSFNNPIAISFMLNMCRLLYYHPPPNRPGNPLICPPGQNGYFAIASTHLFFFLFF